MGEPGGNWFARVPTQARTRSRSVTAMVIARVSDRRRRQMASALCDVRPSRMSSSISDAIASVRSAYWDRRVSEFTHRYTKISRKTHASAHVASLNGDSAPSAIEQMR